MFAWLEPFLLSPLSSSRTDFPTSPFPAFDLFAFLIGRSQKSPSLKTRVDWTLDRQEDDGKLAQMRDEFKRQLEVVLMQKTLAFTIAKLFSSLLSSMTPSLCQCTLSVNGDAARIKGRSAACANLASNRHHTRLGNQRATDATFKPCIGLKYLVRTFDRQRSQQKAMCRVHRRTGTKAQQCFPSVWIHMVQV